MSVRAPHLVISRDPNPRDIQRARLHCKKWRHESQQGGQLRWHLRRRPRGSRGLRLGSRPMDSAPPCRTLLLHFMTPSASARGLKGLRGVTSGA